MSSVSVILTCYNEGPYIRQAVESVLNQSRSDAIDRIVIADDGSDESTLSVLTSIEDLDDRILILYGPGGVGLPGQRCKAIAETQSEYIAILDGDDFWTEDKLESQIGILDTDPAVGLVYADFFGFPDLDVSRARRAGVRDISGATDLASTYFLNDPPIIPSTTLIRRSAYEACGGFDPHVRIFEDTDFYLRLARVTRFACVDKPLLYKRSRGASITGGRKDLLAHHALVALKAAADNAELMPLVPRRLAERARRLSNQRFLLNDPVQARVLSAFALRLRWTDPAIWQAYILARLPAFVAAALRKSVFASRVQALTLGDGE